MADYTPTPDQPPEAAGAAMYQKMLDGGAPLLQVDAWKAGLKQKMLDGGAPPDQVKSYWGENTPDTSNLTAQVQANLKPNQHLANNPMDSLAAGWQNSGLGLATHAPTLVQPENAGIVSDLTFAAGQMVGDIPNTITGAVGGALAGAPAGPETAAAGGLFGSGAYPQAMREVLLDHYNHPDGPFNWQDTLTETAKIAFDSAKAGATNLVGGKAGEVGGQLVGKALGEFAGPGIQMVGKATGELLGWTAATTTLSSAWQGKIPNAEDFGMSAVLALGPLAAGHFVGAAASQRFQFSDAGKAVVSHLQEIYRRTGIMPKDAIVQASKDPGMMTEILGGTDADGNPTTNALDGVAASQGNKMGGDNAPVKSPFESGVTNFNFTPDGSPVDPQTGEELKVNDPRYAQASAQFSVAQKDPSRIIAVQDPLAPKPEGEAAVPKPEVPPAGIPKPGEMKPEEVPDTLLSTVRTLEDSPDINGKPQVSPAGAIGAHQIEPRTARMYGFDPSMLGDPAYNVRAARAILADLYNHFNGNEADILVAYNAGRGRADRWVAQGRDFNSLPLETKKYLLHAEAIGALDTNFQKQVADNELAGQGAEDGTELPHAKPATEPAEGAPFDSDQIIGEFNKNVAPLPVGEKTNLGISIGKSFRGLQSELSPAASLDRDLFDDKRTVDTEDLFRQSNYGTNSVAERWVNQGIVTLGRDEHGNAEYTAEKGTSIRDAFQAVREDGGTAEGFQAYRFAQRALEKAGQEINLGFDLDKAEHLVNDPKIQKAYARGAAMMQAQTDARAQFLADTGLYSQKRVDAMKDFNRNYISMRRLIDPDAPPPVPGRTWGLKQPVKKMTGTSKALPILDPQAVEADNIRIQTAMGVRNVNRIDLINKLLDAQKENGQSLVSLSKLSKNVVVAEVKRAQDLLAGKGVKDENGIQLPDEVRDLMEPFVNAKELYDGLRKSGHIGPDEQPILVFRKGEPEVWKTGDPRLAKMFDQNNWGGKTDPMLEVANIASRFAKTGIVGSPAFFVRSAFHAAFGMSGLSEGSFKSIQLPFQALIEGTFDGIMGGKAWDEFKTNGGGYSAWSDLDTNYLSADQNELLEKGGALNGVVNSVRHPVEALRLAQHATHTAMQVGRYKALRRDGYPVLKSAMLARKAGLDYAEQQTSAFINAWGRTVPFMPVFFKDAEQVISALRPQRLAVTALAATTAYLAPTLINFALNKIADQSLPPDKRYDNLPSWMRDSNIVLPPINGVRISIRKPYIGGFLFMTLPEHLMEAAWNNAQGRGPEAVKALTTSFNNMLENMLPSAVPTVINPFLEQATNHSFMTGRPLVPDSLAGLQGWQQYTSGTSDTSKAIARWLGPAGSNATVPGPINPANSSPIVIDNYISQWGGTLATEFWENLGRTISGQSTVEKPGSRFSSIQNNVPHIGSDHAAPDLHDNPFFGSFIVRNPPGGEAVNEFYDNADAVTQAHNSMRRALGPHMDDPAAAQAILARNPLAQMSATGALKTMANMRLAIDSINRNEGMSDDEKRKATDQIGTQMYNFASAFNAQVEQRQSGPPKVVVRGATPVAPGQEPGTP